MLSQRDIYKLSQVGITIFKNKIIVQDPENPGNHLFEIDQPKIAQLKVTATNDRDYSKTQRFGIFRAFRTYEAPRIYRLTIELKNGQKRFSRMTDIDLIGVNKAINKLNEIIQHES